MQRSRYLYFILILLTIITGLLSRTSIIPSVVYPYLGDFLYAVMSFFIVGFLFPKMKTLPAVFCSVLFCYFIEFFQLCELDFFEKLRQNQFMRLILGQGFLWSDMFCYTLGGFSCYWIENTRGFKNIFFRR